MKNKKFILKSYKANTNNIIKYLLALIFVHLTAVCFVTAQNVYGVSGHIKTPTAYTLTDGKIFASTSLYDDYYRSENKKQNLFWIQSFNIGFHSRLEVGIRLVKYPDPKIKGHDRNLSVKAAIIEEKKYLPQISIGIQDIVGTRRYNNTYFVASKSFSITNEIITGTSLGYGTKLSDVFHSTNASDYREQGVFASISASYTDIVTIMFEYHEWGFDGGVQIRPLKWLYLKGFVNNEKYYGGLLGIYFDL